MATQGVLCEVYDVRLPCRSSYLSILQHSCELGVSCMHCCLADICTEYTRCDQVSNSLFVLLRHRLCACRDSSMLGCLLCSSVALYVSHPLMHVTLPLLSLLQG
jgi:hypothetical protein